MKNENARNDIEIEQVKLKMHLKYISSICVCVVAIVIVAATYNKNEFVNQISFAGMISSIILSVIAIIITLIGEMKSDNTKDKLINISDDLENVTKDISEATSKLEFTLNSSKEISNSLNMVQKNLENIGQIISYKDIETSNEIASDSSYTEDKEEIYDCYIEIFKDVSITLAEEIYKDISLTLFYIAVKKDCGSSQISYQEYIDDFNKLQIQLNSQNVGWDVGLLFSRALWSNDNFNRVVRESIYIRYMYDVNKIMSLKQPVLELNTN